MGGFSLGMGQGLGTVDAQVADILSQSAGSTLRVSTPEASRLATHSAIVRHELTPVAEQIAPPGVMISEPWQGLLGLIAWVSVALIAAAALMKKRHAWLALVLHMWRGAGRSGQSCTDRPVPRLADARRIH